MEIDEDAQLLESGATKLKCMYYKLEIGRGEGTIYFIGYSQKHALLHCASKCCWRNRNAAEQSTRPNSGM